MILRPTLFAILAALFLTVSVIGAVDPNGWEQNVAISSVGSGDVQAE